MSKVLVFCVTIVIVAICGTACFMTYEHKETTRRAFELGYTKMQKNVFDNSWVRRTK